MGHLKHIIMGNTSVYESRTGRLSCKPEEFYGFITDVRNFKQFIPAGSIKDWQATADSCSFYISPLGELDMKVTAKIPFTIVSFAGNAFKNNEFAIYFHISEDQSKQAEVRLTFSVEFNPVLKMMASGYVDKFLETLIDEMEKFRNWNN
jgi:carbon monoxide dehydrogenase subunit G